MKMFTDPTALCSRIAAVASAKSTVEDKTAEVQALLDELDSHVSARTGVINMHIEHLRQNVMSWKEEGSVPDIDSVHQSVLRLAQEYRSAWEQSAKGLQPETKRLCRKLLIEPAYDRVIDVTQRLQRQPANPQAALNLKACIGANSCSLKRLTLRRQWSSLEGAWMTMTRISRL